MDNHEIIVTKIGDKYIAYHRLKLIAEGKSLGKVTKKLYTYLKGQGL